MASSGPRAKRSRFLTGDPAVVAELVQDEESSNEGMSSGEESELDRQLANESDESSGEEWGEADSGEDSQDDSSSDMPVVAPPPVVTRHRVVPAARVGRPAPVVPIPHVPGSFYRAAPPPPPVPAPAPAPLLPPAPCMGVYGKTRLLCVSACSTGWVPYGKSCYLVIDIPTLNWSDARRNCQKMGADLVKITSAGQNRFILDLISKQKKQTLLGAWLGLHRKTDTKFYWADDTPLAGYTSWATGEPNNPSLEKCVNMYGSLSSSEKGKWNDYSCIIADKHIALAPVPLCQKDCK